MVLGMFLVTVSHGLGNFELDTIRMHSTYWATTLVFFKNKILGTKVASLGIMVLITLCHALGNYELDTIQNHGTYLATKLVLSSTQKSHNYMAYKNSTPRLHHEGIVGKICRRNKTI